MIIIPLACKSCGHKWPAEFPPVFLDQLIARIRDTDCPSCGAGYKAVMHDFEKKSTRQDDAATERHRWQRSSL
jgi:uncharacterized Zn-finger protein